MADDVEREHAASAKRRGQFAEKGQTARSRELTGAMVLAAGAYLITKEGDTYAAGMVQLTQFFLGDLGRPLDATILFQMGGTFLRIVLPVSLISASGAIIAALVQHKGVLPFRAVDIDFSRVDPLSKLIQMFKLKESLINIASLLVKVALLGTVFYIAAKGPLLSYITRVPAALGPALREAGGIFDTILRRGIFASLVFGGLDFGLQWYRTEQRMKMSTTEVKEETKEAQGDAQIKGRRRKMARDLLQRRSLGAVPKADVVLVNPTHVAVALLYDDKKMEAPIVVAKGGDAMAEKIRGIARRHGVPIVTQPPLARLLYAKVKVGRAVPGEVYQAIAVILAHCYRLKKRAA